MKKIGELLVEAGVVSSSHIQEALVRQRTDGSARLGEILVARGLASNVVVAQALAHQFELPFARLPSIPPEISALVPLEIQAQHRIVPFRLERDAKGERLHLAIADPAELA